MSSRGWDKIQGPTILTRTVHQTIDALPGWGLRHPMRQPVQSQKHSVKLMMALPFVSQGC